VSPRPNVLLPLIFALMSACLGAWTALRPHFVPAWILAVAFFLLAALALRLALCHARNAGHVPRDPAIWHEQAVSPLTTPGSDSVAQELQASEVRFLKVFRYNPIAMALIRPDLAIALTNRQFRRLSGIGEEGLVGRPIDLVVEESDRDEFIVIIRRTLDNQPHDEWREFRVRHHDGSSRWTRVSTECIQDGAGQVIYVLLMAEDVTERKRFDADRAAYQERLESLSRRLLEAQEEERRHVARELHDELGQRMTAIKIGLRSLADRRCESLCYVDEISGQVDELIEQVRRLSRELRPSILDDLGLESALRWLVDQQRKGLDLVVHLSFEGLEDRLPQWVETACFRVVQEALTNVMRHARASAVWVRVLRRQDVLEFSVDDNGRGFEQAAAHRDLIEGKSLGLLSMDERVTLLGGHLKIRSGIGQGTRVSVRIPLACKADGEQEHVAGLSRPLVGLAT